MGTFKNPDVWKQNLAYQIGDFVLYNGVVYMAIKPVPAGTAMSNDYWTVFEEGAIVPTGEISITENGEVDVAQYATANVNVEGGGSGGSSTQTLTVTKDNESDTVSVATIGWADLIAQNYDAYVEVQPDSTEGLVSIYSITVGTAFIVRISGDYAGLYLDAEMRVGFNARAMPSTPLYASIPK